MKLHINGKVILTDPMLGKKDSIRSFAGIAKNPTVELPIDPYQIIDGVDFCLVSHTHPDHFDDWSFENIPKSMKIYCQPCDETVFKEKGFQNVEVIENNVNVDGIEIIRTNGEHGSGEILKMMGIVSGFVIKSHDNPTVYWIGDSILNNDVRETMRMHNPDYVITHSGGAAIPGFNPILMDQKETIDILDIIPSTRIIAIHMNALDHCRVTRDILREYAASKAIGIGKLIIPDDGEILELQ